MLSALLLLLLRLLRIVAAVVVVAEALTLKITLMRAAVRAVAAVG